MTEQDPSQNPAAANVDPSHINQPLDTHVDQLLNSENLRTTCPDEEQQGKFIVDRFVGELVALGSVESGGQTKDAATVIDDIEKSVNLSSRKGNTWDGPTGTINYIARQKGIRNAINLMASDSRTGNYLGDLTRRVTIKDGALAFGSLDQVRGYLDAKEEAGSGSGWASIIAEEVTNQALGEDPGVPRWQAHDLLSSDVAPVRNDQLRYANAERAAQAAGVDMELVKRSTTELQQRKEQDIFIGQAAVSQAVTSNYDNLFK